MTSDSDMRWGWRSRWGGMWMAQSSDASFSGNRGGAQTQSYGQGGSMARFTLMSGHLCSEL